MKNKRSKKYNKFKLTQTKINRLSKTILVAWAGGYKEPLCFDLDGNELDITTDDIKMTFMHRAMPWSSLCIVLLRDQFEKEYLQSLPVKSIGSYKYSDLAELLNKEHDSLLASVNDQHKVNSAWVASPSGYSVSDELANKILTKMEAWNHPAKWEK